MPIGNSPESLSRAMLVGTILVGGLGVVSRAATTSEARAGSRARRAAMSPPRNNNVFVLFVLIEKNYKYQNNDKIETTRNRNNKDHIVKDSKLVKQVNVLIIS